MGTRKKRRPRGTGCIYQRGPIYWIKYYQNGMPISESSKSRDAAAAQKLLSLREGEIAQNRIPGVYYNVITFKDMVDMITRDYGNNKKNIVALNTRLVHLKEFFGNRKAAQIDTMLVNRFVDKKIKEGYSNASVNRMLATLKRMYKLAEEANQIDHRPVIKMLVEDNVRQGFFEQEDFVRLMAVIEKPFDDFFILSYFLGWRTEEVRGLTWDRVDLEEGALSVYDTKNKRPVHIPIKEVKPVMDALRRRLSARHLHCKYVFQENGQRVGKNRLYEVWHEACNKAGLAGKIPHDFRRSAARNLIRYGVSQPVAMRITNHKTMSVFNRYNITSETDLKEAMGKVYEGFKQKSLVTSLVTIPEKVIPINKAINE